MDVVETQFSSRFFLGGARLMHGDCDHKHDRGARDPQYRVHQHTQEAAFMLVSRAQRVSQHIAGDEEDGPQE
ncbi:MAG TPA: hypothetical protein VIO94_15505 [Phenylobacterium sp.]